MLDNLIEGAKFLFENKRYKDSAQVLKMTSEFISNPIILDKIYANMRMCYFLSNDVPNAFKVLELQENLQVNDSFELKRDKANFLRYLNRHEEAYNTAKEISDDPTRCLALSWFLHKEGKTKEAFAITEQARTNSYWWKREPNYRYKLWKGSKVKTLVIAEESGFGDQIIFARYIPMLKELCDELYYDGTGLTKTFCRNFDIKPMTELNKFDNDIYLIPIMSLAYVLGIEQPTSSTYLTADSSLIEMYNNIYPKTKKRIGLCVQGEKTHVETNLRKLPLNELASKLQNYGEVINLQKEIDETHDAIRYINFDSWEDTLALISTCDVVVTCDTSISHAASALGIKTIVLIHAAAYFTWNHNQDLGKSEWYDNAYCIHQDYPCDWSGAITKCLTLL